MWLCFLDSVQLADSSEKKSKNRNSYFFVDSLPHGFYILEPRHWNATHFLQTSIVLSNFLSVYPGGISNILRIFYLGMPYFWGFDFPIIPALDTVRVHQDAADKPKHHR